MFQIFVKGKYHISTEGTIEQARALVLDTYDLTGAFDIDIRAGGEIVEQLVDYDTLGLVVADDVGIVTDEFEGPEPEDFVDDLDGMTPAQVAEIEADILDEIDQQDGMSFSEMVFWGIMGTKA